MVEAAGTKFVFHDVVSTVSGDSFGRCLTTNDAWISSFRYKVNKSAVLISLTIFVCFKYVT